MTNDVPRTTLEMSNMLSTRIIYVDVGYLNRCAEAITL